MRKFLLVSAMLVPMLVMGCGLTVQERQELSDAITGRVTAAVLEKTKEVAKDVAEKAVEVIAEKAEDLGLSAEKAKELADAAAEQAEEAVAKLIEEKVPPAIRTVVDKVLPEATEEGAGKGVAGWLYMATQVLLGIGKKGILGGVA